MRTIHRNTAVNKEFGLWLGLMSAYLLSILYIQALREGSMEQSELPKPHVSSDFGLWTAMDSLWTAPESLGTDQESLQRALESQGEPLDSPGETVTQT